MSLYEKFKTDDNIEKQGIVLDYDFFRIRIARAGGGNKKFTKLVEKLTKPHRRAIQAEMMSLEEQEKLVLTAFSRAVVLDWETKIDGEFVQGIEGPNGELIPFSEKAVFDTLEALPELYKDLQQSATKAGLFREAEREADAGNSEPA